MIPVPEPRPARLLRLLATAAVLLPCLYGFGGKFIELVRVSRLEADGAFAIAPIVNYLLASSGFLLLFCWAAGTGMLRDVESPKQAMLDNEARLDHPQ
jgi:hypothetical protein